MSHPRVSAASNAVVRKGITQSYTVLTQSRNTHSIVIAQTCVQLRNTSVRMYIAVTTALGEFARREIKAQGLSVKDFASKSGLGLSHTYQILRGDRSKRTSAETVEAVARGLGLTPAELAVAMSHGAPDEDPQRAVVSALVRQVRREDLTTVERILRAFHVPATTPVAKTSQSGGAKGAARITKPVSNSGEHGSDNTQTHWCAPVLRPLALAALVHG